MQASINSVVGNLIDNINLLLELGERSVPMDPKVLQGLSKVTATPTHRNRPVSRQTPPAHSVTQRARTPSESRSLDDLQKKIAACELCSRTQYRVDAMPGQGEFNHPDVMFIGEAPEIWEGQIFHGYTGATGELLTAMIKAMGYTMDEVYLTNICKCPVPNNKAPSLKEVQECLPHLREEIALVKPKAIVIYGNNAIHALLATQRGISTAIRGEWTVYQRIPVMPIYHPAYITRFERAGSDQVNSMKRETWRALQKVMQQVGSKAARTRKNTG